MTKKAKNKTFKKRRKSLLITDKCDYTKADLYIKELLDKNTYKIFNLPKAGSFSKYKLNNKLISHYKYLTESCNDYIKYDFDKQTNYTTEKISKLYLGIGLQSIYNFN